MKTVSYAKQTIESRNPIARLTHTSRIKKSIKYTKMCLPDKGSILDFGSGEGDFLKKLAQEKPEANLYGYDPYKNRSCSDFTQVNNLEYFKSSSLDVITAFEVCEHLYETEIHDFLKQAVSLLKCEGKVIISVPVMYGLALIPKELNKMWLNKRQSVYTLNEFYSAILGKQILRPESPRHTHKGFDFRWFENILQNYLTITKKSFSPFVFLPWYTNSQCFFECTKSS